MHKLRKRCTLHNKTLNLFLGILMGIGLSTTGCSRNFPRGVWKVTAIMPEGQQKVWYVTPIEVSWVIDNANGHYKQLGRNTIVKGHEVIMPAELIKPPYFDSEQAKADGAEAFEIRFGRIILNHKTDKFKIEPLYDKYESSGWY